MKDLTGQIFGDLVAIKPMGLGKEGGYLWLCKCKCGNEKIIRSNSLVSNKTKSCGCLEYRTNKLIDRTGEKWGKLTIISKAEGNRKKWLVRCECGNEKIVMYGNLVSCCTKSCGCWLKETAKWHKSWNKKSPGESARNALIWSYKNGAKERGLVWGLTIEQFENITKSNCYYCGIAPYRKGRTDTDNGHYIYNGIDRVDNYSGYTIDNVVPCCKTCNRAKDTMTHSQFVEWVKRVASNFEDNNILFNKTITYESKNKTQKSWTENN